MYNSEAWFISSSVKSLLSFTSLYLSKYPSPYVFSNSTVGAENTPFSIEPYARVFTPTFSGWKTFDVDCPSGIWIFPESFHIL